MEVYQNRFFEKALLAFNTLKTLEGDNNNHAITIYYNGCNNGSDINKYTFKGEIVKSKNPEEIKLLQNKLTRAASYIYLPERKDTIDVFEFKNYLGFGKINVLNCNIVSIVLNDKCIFTKKIEKIMSGKENSPCDELMNNNYKFMIVSNAEKAKKAKEAFLLKEAKRIAELPNDIEQLKVTVVSLENNSVVKSNELKNLTSKLSDCNKKYLVTKFPSRSTLGTTGALATGYLAAKMRGGDNNKEANRIAELPNDIEKLKIIVITLQNNLKKMDDELREKNKELAECKYKISIEPNHGNSGLATKVAALATGYHLGETTGGYKKTLKKRNKKNKKSKTRRNLK